ncbi:hypothetical protein GDO86_008547 [Hymenochirus boettgeri]|uniref:ADF-H domain-containing protein n=1 Tax=Hymenochirus boettgeri TaxID=247094 RepID=A0A8T2IY01_9PIPI|nr:hypothetical protein GDO86_008547 [Hymenochirus boettgeri]
MASGVKVDDSVVTAFNDMKLRSCNKDTKKQKKVIFLRLSDDNRAIIVEAGKDILVGDIGHSVPDPFMAMVERLPTNDCRYVLYDAWYETKDSKKEELVFILWAPEQATLKSKMIYAASKDALKTIMGGVKHVWQMNTLEDLLDKSNVIDKLSASVSFEGKPVHHC